MTPTTYPPCTPTSSVSTTATVNGSHRFTVQGYSLAKGIGVDKFIASDTFTAGGYQWAVHFYPDGKNPEDNSSYVSVFIALASEGTDVRALFELSLIDQSGEGNHRVDSHFDRSLESGPYTLKNRGSTWGYKRYFRREMLESSSFLKDDCLKFECTVGVVVSAIDSSRLRSMKAPTWDIGFSGIQIVDNNDMRPTAGQGSEPHVETGGDWRTQLTTDMRSRVVNKILDCVKKHLPFPGQDEGLEKIAVRFEEKIYTAATSKIDYLRKISMKMLTMDSKYQNTNPNSFPPNSSGNNNIALESGEVWNQGHPPCMSMSTDPTRGGQQTMSQTSMGSSGVESCASLPPVVGQNYTVPGIPQPSSGISSARRLPSDMFANPQQYLNYQQLQQLLLNQKFQQMMQRPNIPLQQQIPQNALAQQKQLRSMYMQPNSMAPIQHTVSALQLNPNLLKQEQEPTLQLSQLRKQYLGHQKLVHLQLFLLMLLLLLELWRFLSIGSALFNH